MCNESDVHPRGGGTYDQTTVTHTLLSGCRRETWRSGPGLGLAILGLGKEVFKGLGAAETGRLHMGMNVSAGVEKQEEKLPRRCGGPSLSLPSFSFSLPLPPPFSYPPQVFYLLTEHRTDEGHGGSWMGLSAIFYKYGGWSRPWSSVSCPCLLTAVLRGPVKGTGCCQDTGPAPDSMVWRPQTKSSPRTLIQSAR